MTGPSLVCTSCRTPLPADAQFCLRCGAATPTQVSGGGTTTFAETSDQTTERQHEIQAALGPDYVVERRIGSGGFAEVWAATDKKLQRRVAVKVLHPELVASRSLIERFEREAQAVAKLRHPGVIPIYAVGRHEDLAYYVMPLVEGENLRDRLSREGALPPDEVRRILKETAAALAVAHEAGIVHRDIKPENLMLEGKERRVLVMDFGIAKSTVGAQTGLTGTGMIIGTPAYMSPEQATGSKEIDARSDVYSLGIVGFELLTGKPPFKADSVPELIVQHVTAEAPSLRSVAPGAPEALVVAIDRCLAKDPAQRWIDAGAFAASLGDAAPAVSAAVGKRIGARKKRYAVIGGAAVGILAAAAVMLWAPWRQRETIRADIRPRQVTFRGDVCGSSISPDGRYLAYVAAKQLWVLDLDQDRAWPVSDSVPEFRCWFGFGFRTALWTGGAQHVVFVRGDSTYQARTNGDRASRVGPGAVAESLTSHAGKIIGTVDPQRGDTGSWSAITVRALGHGVVSVPLTGFRWAYTSDELVSPDGERVLVQVGSSARMRGFVIVDVDSGHVVSIDTGALNGWPSGWSPDGQALYVQPDSGSGLLRYALDLARLRLSGRSTGLLPEVGQGDVNRSFARLRNRMAFERTLPNNQVIIGRLGPSGTQHHWSLERLVPGSLVPSSAAMTPDGRRLLFLARADTSISLFEMAIAGGAPRRLARLSDATDAEHIRLAPDGLTAVLGIWDGHRHHSVLVDLRSGATRELPGWRPQNYFMDCETFDWDPTGRIVFAGNAGAPGGIIRMNAVSGVADTLRPDSSAHVACPAASPDGKWLAVRYVNLPRHGILLLPLSSDSARLFPVPGREHYPLGWLNSGELLVLERPNADSSEVWVYRLAGGRSMLGKLPNHCWAAQLVPSRHDIVCIEARPRTDVWIADDFDPYFHPSRASTPRR